MKRTTIGVLMLFAFATVGCGAKGKGVSLGSLTPVKGTLTIDEQPLVGATVTLYPLENTRDQTVPIIEGIVDEQGRYSVKTFDRDGAPVGKYRVCVEVGGINSALDAQFDPVYGRQEKSPLVLDVTSKPQPGAYDLKLQPRRNP